LERHALGLDVHETALQVTEQPDLPNPAFFVGPQDRLLRGVPPDGALQPVLRGAGLAKRQHAAGQVAEKPRHRCLALAGGPLDVLGRRESSVGQKPKDAFVVGGHRWGRCE
jgi:hypothetical protein